MTLVDMVSVCMWCGLQATDNMKVTMTQANFERNLAVQQVTRLKQEIDELSRHRHAVCLYFLAQKTMYSSIALIVMYFLINYCLW